MQDQGENQVNAGTQEEERDAISREYYRGRFQEGVQRVQDILRY